MTHEEALTRIKTWHLDDDAMEVLSTLIPELKESGDEGKVMKGKLREILRLCYEGRKCSLCASDYEKLLTWLEKQAEQKPIKEHNVCTFCEEKYGCVSPCPTKLIEEQKSADKAEPKFKVGDVIRLKGGAAEYTIRRVTDTTYYTDGWSQSIERCEEDYELVEQKPVWGEKDDRMLDRLIKHFDWESDYYFGKNDCDEAQDWLKSLKEKMRAKQGLSEDAATNEYIDLGLPSGTMWKSFNEDGYYTFDEAVEEFSYNLPNDEQWGELKDKCKWKRLNNGYKVTGPNGKSIFLLANGYRIGTKVYDSGTDGHYWSGTNNDAGYSCVHFDDADPEIYHALRYYGRSVRLVK